MMRELMNAPFYVSKTNEDVKVWAYRIKSFKVVGLDDNILEVEVSSKERLGYPKFIEVDASVKVGAGVRNGGYIVYYTPNEFPMYVSSREFNSLYKLSPESNYWLGELLEDSIWNDENID